MQLQDKLTLGTPKRTKDGFMAVRARAARSGVYDYAPSEVGAPDDFSKDVVKVYRPEDEVFSKDSIASFIAKPVTNDHPSVPVTSDNWKKFAGGAVMGALRDKEYLAFDLTIMDKALIEDIDSGKRELSNGYSLDLKWEAGTSPDGEAFDAIQTNIRGNHVAVVDAGRAGSACRIPDSKFAACDANPAAISGFPKEEPKMKIMIGDAEVDATNGEAVKVAVGTLNTDLASTKEKLKDSQKDVAKLTAEKTALETKVSDAENLDMDKLVADRATLVASAKAIDADVVTDGKSSSEIRKSIVDSQLGDAAKDFDDAQISAAFAVIAKDVKTEDERVVPLNPSIAKDAKTKLVDLRAKRNAALSNAHKGA